MPIKDPVKRKIAVAKYQEAHRDELRAKRHVWYLAHKDRWNEYAKRTNAGLRTEVLDHYGRACECCGDAHEEFLCIDHVNGGGNEHRRRIGPSNFYRWLKRNGWPIGFRVLCHNCNMSLGLRGYCPHELEKR